MHKVLLPWIGAAAVALLVLAAYWPVTLTSRMTSGDSFWYVPTAMSLIHEGNLDLNEFQPDVDALTQDRKGVVPFNTDRRLARIDDRVYNFYNLYTGIVSVPLVWVLDQRWAAEQNTIRRAMMIAPVVAKVCASLTVGLFFLLLCRLDFSRLPALGLSALFAFATPHFSNHAGGLWSHNTSSLMLVLGLLLLTTRRAAWLSALPVAMAFMMRADMWLLVVGFTLWMLLYRRRQLFPFLLLGGIMAVGFFLQSYAVYGHLLPPKHSHGGTLGSLQVSLPGLLISPNRGLFIFCPVLVFGAWAVIPVLRRWKTAPSIQVLSAFLVLIHWLFLGLWYEWWGGWSYGPRFFATVAPLWVLLVGHAFSGWSRWSPGWRKSTVILLTVLTTWSVYVQVLGVTQLGPHQWNSTPVNVDTHPERIWDWSDWQIARRETAPNSKE